MFFVGVLTPGRRAAAAAPAKRARASAMTKRRLISLASFSTAVVMPFVRLVEPRGELAVLVWPRWVEHEQLRNRDRAHPPCADRFQDHRIAASVQGWMSCISTIEP